MSKILSKILILFIPILLFYNCRDDNNKQPVSCDYYTDIQSSMVICREGNGFFSKYFRKYASKEKIYSHIGIISIENDSVFVYHAEASELTGIGHVKKEKLASFLKNIKKYDFFEFDYTDSIKHAILNNVIDYYNKRTPFDTSFDSFDDNAVYCTELIAVSINKALGKNEIVPSIKMGGKLIFGLDDIYQNEHMKKVE